MQCFQVFLYDLPSMKGGTGLEPNSIKYCCRTKTLAFDILS
jgi:hypothetical protein